MQSNGGFVSLDLLNTLQFAGGGSEADATNAPLAEASGTGACLSTASSTNPCPTSPSSSLSGLASSSTQDAVASGNGTTATPTGSSACPVPINTPLLDVDVTCGTASASVDASGDPTASGNGSLAKVSMSLSLTDFLQSLVGPLPSRLVAVRQRPRRLRHGWLQLEPAPVLGVLAPGHGERDPARQPRSRTRRASPAAARSAATAPS